jgi:hypothetical protein
MADNKYEIVLRNQYYLGELAEKIELTDSIDEIAYKADITLPVTEDLYSVGITPGDMIRVSGIPYGGSDMDYLLHPAVVWECNSKIVKSLKRMEVTAYDRTIYLDKSEDEYLFLDGTTATQRIKQYCNDWGIPISNIPDTGIPLAKAVHRAQTIYNMIKSDLEETAQKGGNLYKPRMAPNGFELYEIGSNDNPLRIELAESIEQNRTLEKVITQVKILGKSEEEGRSPVLAVLKGMADKYGTLQKILQDEKITSTAQATEEGQQLLTGVQEKFTIEAIDINMIRAGDEIFLNDMPLIVISVKHELGNPGHMTLDVASLDYVRRNYYAKSV